MMLCQLVFLFAIASPQDEADPTQQIEARIEQASQRVSELSESLGSAHPDTAAALNELGQALHDAGHYQEALDPTRRAVAIRERTLGAEHADTAVSQFLLGYVFLGMGRLKESKAAYQRSYDIRLIALGADHAETGVSLNAVAWVLFMEGDLRAALVPMEKALAIIEKAKGPEHEQTALAINDLGWLKRDLANYDEAQSLFMRAVEIRENALGPDHLDTAESLNGLSTVLINQGELRRARPLLERALGIRMQALGPDHPTTGYSIQNLGLLLFGLGEFEEAGRQFRQVLSIYTRVAGRENWQCTASMLGLGLVQFELGNLDEATQLTGTSARIRREQLGALAPDSLLALSDHLRCLLRQGRTAEAAEALDRAFPSKEERERVFEIRAPWVAKVIDAVSYVERCRGNTQESLRLSNLVLKIALDNLDFDHMFVGQAYAHRAAALLSAGETESAFESALKAMESSLKRIGGLLPSLPEHERLAYAGQTHTAMNLLLSLALQLGDDSERIAYRAVLAWKGQVSRSLLATRAQMNRSTDDSVHGLLDELARVQAALSKEIFTTVPGDPAAHEYRLSSLREQRGRLERQLAETMSGAGSDFDTNTSVGVADLANSMGPNSASVDFFVYEAELIEELNEGTSVVTTRHRQPHLAAWIIRGGRDELLRVEFGPAKEVESAVRLFLARLNISRGVSIGSNEADGSGLKEANNRLRSVLWDRLKGPLDGARVVFVSPDLFLGTLPLEVLQLEDGTYLIEHFSFDYLQDMVSLVHLKSAQSGNHGAGAVPPLLCVGGVDFNRRATAAVVETSASPSDSGAHYEAISRSFSKYWNRLPVTKGESDAVAELHRAVAGGARQTLLQGDAPTEERVKSEMVQNGVIHFATHGFFQPEGLPSMWDEVREDDGVRMVMREEARRVVGMLPGLLSGIVLAGANDRASEAEDGLLTAEEMSFLDLSGVDLIVLSACDTGLGRSKGGEGMLGLRRTLRQAGARTVISSLWSVQDDSTGELMQGFYQRLWIGGEGKLEALRGAQLDMLKRNRIEFDGDGLPVTWGAFVLDGEWN